MAYILDIETTHTEAGNMSNAMNPLPSLLRASAFDAANMNMRANGRTKWNDDDWNVMCDTQDRLVAGCYGKIGDNQPNMKFIRFQIAEHAEKLGEIGLRSDWAKVLAAIDAKIQECA